MSGVSVRPDHRVTVRFNAVEMGVLERLAGRRDVSVGAFVKLAVLASAGLPLTDHRRSTGGLTRARVRRDKEDVVAHVSHAEASPAGSRPVSAAPTLLSVVVALTGSVSLAVRALRLGRVRVGGVVVRSGGVGVDPSQVRVVS